MDFNGNVGLRKAVREHTSVPAMNVALQGRFSVSLSKPGNACRGISTPEKLGGASWKTAPNETSIEKELDPSVGTDSLQDA